MGIIQKYTKQLMGQQKGQDLAEYAMLIGLIAILVVVTVTLLGSQISATFGGIAMEIGGWGIGG